MEYFSSHNIKRALYVFGVIVACLLFLFTINVVIEKSAMKKVNNKSAHAVAVSVGDSVIWTEVANTEATREHGLSGKITLAPNTGMLFVFEQSGMWGFWMKNMLFPIDIIWLDVSGKVVTMAQNVYPKSYPKVFYPISPALYVLEVPTGFCNEHYIKEGSVIAIPKGL